MDYEGDYEDSIQYLTQEVLIGLKVFFVGVAGIAVVLRLAAAWRYNRRLLIDDYISISAIPFLIVVVITSTLAGNGFNDPNSSPYRIAQFAVTIAVFTPLSLWTCKAPILFLYLRLFGIKKWLRIASYTTLSVMAAVYLAGIFGIPPACTPPLHEHHLSEQFITQCQTRTRIVNVFLGIVSVVADLVILILPMPVVFGLKLLVRNRIGLLILFLSGLFAVGSSIISLYFKSLSLKLPATSLALSILATVTECSVALIVGCVPSLRLLWSKLLKPRISDQENNNNRTNNSQYLVVGEGTDKKDTFEFQKTNKTTGGLVISTEIHTSTSISTVPAVYHHEEGQLDGQPYYGQTYQQQQQDRHTGQFGQVQPPFGVYTEAYALQTRNNGVWGQ